MNQASKAKVWVLLLHFIALFTPIYEVNFFGTKIIAYVSDIVAGPVIVIVFLAASIWNFIVLRYKNDFLKWTQFGILGAMILLILALWIGTDSTSVVGVSMTFQVILTIMYGGLVFFEHQTLSFFDKVVGVRNQALQKLDELFGKEPSKDHYEGEYEILD